MKKISVLVLVLIVIFAATAGASNFLFSGIWNEMRNEIRANTESLNVEDDVSAVLDDFINDAASLEKQRALAELEDYYNQVLGNLSELPEVQTSLQELIDMTDQLIEDEKIRIQYALNETLNGN